MVFAYCNGDGQTAYKGLVTSVEIKQADCRIADIKANLVSAEKEYKASYKTSGLYAYFLGKVLDDYREKYSVPNIQLEDFLKEIVSFVLPKLTVKSLMTYILVARVLTAPVAEKLSAKQWEQLFAKPEYIQDARIFQWIGDTPVVFNKDVWSVFFKNLKSLLKRKDTSVFSDKELFALYDTLLTEK